MKTQRGRKSAAELSTKAVIEVVPRPAAPDHITADEARIWERTVGSMMAGYFTAADGDMLAAYCQHTASVRRLAAWIETALERDTDLDELDRLHRMRDRESRAALACARALRLTQQSRIGPKGAHGQVASTCKKPWEWNDG